MRNDGGLDSVRSTDSAVDRCHRGDAGSGRADDYRLYS